MKKITIELDEKELQVTSDCLNDGLISMDDYVRGGGGKSRQDHEECIEYINNAESVKAKIDKALKS